MKTTLLHGLLALPLALLAAPGDISTVAGSGSIGGTGNGGPATSAAITGVAGLAVDSEGNFFLADYYYTVRRVDAASGLIDLHTGSGLFDHTGDGGPALDAAISGTKGIALDRRGNLFIADYHNHCIRRVDASDGFIDTVAGIGEDSGFFGDGGPANSAKLNYPSCVAVDAAGNLFIADNNNRRIRRVDAVTGDITTVAGNGNNGIGGGIGDGGPALSAPLGTLDGLCLDSKGNLYIAESSNHQVRRVDAATGIIDTVAGTGTVGYNGDGIAADTAQLHTPHGITCDGNDHLYICDHHSNRIRRVDVITGIISTIAGKGMTGYAGDEGPAIEARIFQPRALAFDPRGNLLISDAGNKRIRRVEAAGAPTRFQPDAEVGKSPGRLRGDDIYNRNGSRQTQSLKCRRGGSARFSFSAESDAECLFLDTLTLSASKGKRDYQAKYLHAGRGNVTAAITRGALRFERHEPGMVETLRATVKTNRGSTRKSANILVTAKSATRPGGSDTVRAKLRMK